MRVEIAHNVSYNANVEINVRIPQQSSYRKMTFLVALHCRSRPQVYNNNNNRRKRERKREKWKQHPNRMWKYGKNGTKRVPFNSIFPLHPSSVFFMLTENQTSFLFFSLWREHVTVAVVKLCTRSKAIHFWASKQKLVWIFSSNFFLFLQTKNVNDFVHFNTKIRLLSFV